MAVVSREQYFDAAMDILATKGAGALTIAALCARFEVTMGSFYHHFRNVDTFVDALLGHWEAEQTHRVVELTASGNGSAQKTRSSATSASSSRTSPRRRSAPGPRPTRAWPSSSDAWTTRGWPRCATSSRRSCRSRDSSGRACLPRRRPADPDERPPGGVLGSRGPAADVRRHEPG